MKAILYILFLFCFVQQLQAQNNSEYRIIRSNLGSAGSSVTLQTSNGSYNVSQSIGQSSVIGTYSNNGYYLRQGYQQPSTKVKAKKVIDYNLVARVHPNPFDHLITITFSTIMVGDISVIIFDVNAKPVYSQDFLPSQRIEIGLNAISSGSYFLNVTSNNKRYKTKLIKI